MIVKFLGAVLVIAGCGSVGFLFAATHKSEERALRSLLSAFDVMECELRCRLTPLPDLCRVASQSIRGQLARVFYNLADEMDRQIAPNVDLCMQTALSSVKEMPKQAKGVLLSFGKMMGRFDIEGQLQGLQTIRTECRTLLENCVKNQDVRLRSYQTLALCAGAAIVILFI